MDLKMVFGQHGMKSEMEILWKTNKQGIEICITCIDMHHTIYYVINYKWNIFPCDSIFQDIKAVL